MGDTTSALPRVGDTVHYVSFGTPGGEYGKECRAALVTEHTGDPHHPNQLALAVLNPTGLFFPTAVKYDAGAEVPSSTQCATPQIHGAPMRYCMCGWMQAEFRGGTWHSVH